MSTEIDWNRYRSMGNLRAVMREVGVGKDKKTSPDVCPFHPDTKKHPSFNWFSDKDGNGRWMCMSGCGSGDIYDFVGRIYGIQNKAEQFDWVSRKFGGPGLEFKNRREIKGPVIQPYKPRITPPRKRDLNAELSIQKFLENHPMREQMVKKYLYDRGFNDGPVFESMCKELYYWPGYSSAEETFGKHKLYAAGIPGVYKDGTPSVWDRHGIVIDMIIGWKLRFKDEDGSWQKKGSLGCKYWPPEIIPKKIIIVEGDIDRLAMKHVGFPDVITAGSTSLPITVIDEIIKTNPEEIIILMDGDNPGLEAAGYLVKKDKPKTSLPSKIRATGYTGPIKCVKIPDELDPAAMISSDRTEELVNLICNADIFESIIPDVDQKKTEIVNIPVYDDNSEDAYVKPEPIQEKDWKKEDGSLLWPFRFLGVKDNTHYFISRSQEVFAVPSKSITSNSFLTIAPLEFWQSIKVNAQNNPDWLFITNLIIDHSIAHGAYKPDNIRGTGIWKDGDEIIFSDGNMVHSKTRGSHIVSKFPTKENIFVMAEDMGMVEKELFPEERKNDIDFVNWVTHVLSFKNEEHGRLLFGWMVSSMFLSTLEWRPIAYMKGPSGVGKSWVMNNIVRPFLSDISINPLKSSTIPGVMQAPAFNVRMTVVDELESNSDKKVQELIKNLMQLARDTTSNGYQEKRYTGTADQTGIGREFSSMFIFASIVESSSEDQDVNRITAIEFAPKEKQEIPWVEVSKKIREAYKNGFAKRIRGDILFHRETIYKNIQTFETAASGILNTQRNADQIGTLIGGWYYFENPGHEATFEEAVEIIKRFDLTEQESRAEGNTMKTIMGSILGAKIRYEEEEFNSYGESHMKQRVRSVYEILYELKEKGEDPGPREQLNKELIAYGLRYGHKNYPGKLLIACNHEDVKNMLPKDFSYKNNYKDYLKNHPNYIDTIHAIRFSGVMYMALVFEIDLEDEAEPEKKKAGEPEF